MAANYPITPLGSDSPSSDSVFNEKRVPIGVLCMGLYASTMGG